MFKISKKTVKIVALIISIVFIAGLLFSAIYGVAFAETLQEQLDKANEKKLEAQENLDKVNKEREKSLETLEEFEKEYIALQNSIDEINTQIGETDKLLAEEEQKLAEATKKADAKYEYFKERFRIVCEEGPVSFLELIFSAENFADFVDKIEIAKEITESDKKIFDEMEAIRVQVEDSRNKILELKNTQVASKNTLEEKQAQVNQQKIERENFIKSLEQDAATYQKIIDEEERAMESLKSRISSSLSTSSSGRAFVGGEFMWPSNCTIITSNFSPRRKNPVSGIWKKHTGVDIGASYGSPIYAANGGTVTLAGWNSGYGNCVIIDHGGGKATLYGHMSSIGVSTGQSVSKGQQIGKVGSTGNSTGPHLHFEILINGTAVNPMQYF